MRHRALLSTQPTFFPQSSWSPPVSSGDNDQHSSLLTLWGCLQICKPLQPPQRAFEQSFLRVHTTYLIVNSSHLCVGHVYISTCSLFYYLLSSSAHNFQNGFWKIWHLCSLWTFCDAQTRKNPLVKVRNVFTIILPAWWGCWETTQLQCAKVLCKSKQLPSFL